MGRTLGGGDLKFISVAFLWSGLYCAAPFLVILTSWGLCTISRDIRLGVCPAREWAHQGAVGTLGAAGLIGILISGSLAPV